MNDNPKRRPLGVGLASLFAVLVILCLMVFAVLSRITAKNELALAKKAADSAAAFYAAEVQAAVCISSEMSNETTSFKVEIDKHRELSVVYRIDDGKLVVDEWIVVNKFDGEESADGLPVVGEKMPWEID
ncbi:MAG: hypothetical protein FWF82_05165 [Oscillospiraceae bacterium]|nr:hypothetical protein [Oscillospiraceae bacterium]